MSAVNDDLPADRDEQAASWCIALSEGHLAEREREEFDRWIADPDNALAFEQAARVWNAAESAAEMPEMIGLRGAALQSYQRTNRRRWSGQSPRWRWMGGIAAIFLLAVLSFVLLHNPVERYQTGIGERRVAMLADGSRLSLDADTEVDVRLHDDRRELTLVRGRAKFDVAKDPLRPFTVTAGEKLVVATGTSFSVEMLERRMHVLLYEGHVAVLDSGDKKPVAGRSPAAAADQELTPGRELVAPAGAAGAATVQDVNVPRSLSWEAGQISFDDQPLGEAIERMNRYSRDQFAIGDAQIASVRVNGIFTAGDTDAFVEGITALNAVRADRQGDRIILLNAH